jgi:hypothetical protein
VSVTAREIALCEKENQDHRQHHEERRGHHDAHPFGCAGVGDLHLEGIEPEGKRVEPLIGEIDE